jgi:ADP-heptose:LPS heptosyltransferase
MTTASHLTELFKELCSPTEVILLPRQPGQLWPIIKRWRQFFDLIYLGPRPTVKTRLLGHLLAPGRLWSRHHRNIHPYLLKQILADINALGFSREVDDRNMTAFLPWEVDNQHNPFTDTSPFLVLHPGAKEGWTTTLWPVEKWRELTGRLLEETGFSICVLGVASEETRLRNITESLHGQFHGRIQLCLSRPLKEAASLVSSSAGVICHNSGILHLSTFFQKKTLCITGSSAEYWRPPYPWVVNVTSGSCNLACNCYRCPMPFFNAKCIGKIEVEDVWQGFKKHFGLK